MTDLQSAIAAPSLTNRSRVTNGTRVCENVDGRTREARRFRDLLDGYVTQFGCTDEADLTRCRGAARLAFALEQHDERKLTGTIVDDDAAARLTSRLERILASLAASQKQRKRGGR